MKQETLEEAMDKSGYHDEVNDTMWREGVKFGAKWQQERMYSEEDMQEYAEFCVQCFIKNLPCIIAKDWFTQFKKQQYERTNSSSMVARSHQ
jgi:hypothetical protein